MMRALVFTLIWLVALPQAVFGQEGTTYFSFEWNNDFFYLPAPTDHYFSNGMSVEAGFPELAANPLNRLLIKGKEGCRRQYALQLLQNLYTPIAKDTLAFVPGDRPFASYLTITTGAVATNPDRRLKWQSALQFGVLGRLAGGRLTQNFVHSLTPSSDLVAGWPNEVEPDIVINYNARLEKGLLNRTWYNVNLRLAGRLGTLYTDVSPGIYLEAGSLDPYFTTPLGWVKDRRLKWKVFAGADLRVVGYDATLSGGLFNADDRMRENLDIKRLQPVWEGGLAVTWSACSLAFGFVGRPPEFEGGLSHRYGYLSFRLMK